jgi:hypothetical protein
MSTNGANKDRRRWIACWAGLILIGALFFLSIYGAFLGSSRAKSFFNSPLMVVIWMILTAGLVFSMVVSRRLLQNAGLLLMHTSAIFVLTGSMWGSAVAHNLREKFFDIRKFQTGQMVIYEGQEEKHVISEIDGKIVELPFLVKLKDFRIEYYRPEYLQIQGPGAKGWSIPVEVGREVFLDSDLGSVTVLNSFENFRIKIEGEKRIAVDANGPGSNPALEVQLKDPNGNTTTRYVFARFSAHARPEDKLLLGYYRTIREYISDLQIIKDGKVLAEKSIEVNHPLHFGGYHFYQHNYDRENEQYTVLMVVSDSGLPVVYAGYVMLCIGVFEYFWMQAIFGKKQKAG